MICVVCVGFVVANDASFTKTDNIPNNLVVKDVNLNELENKTGNIPANNTDMYSNKLDNGPKNITGFVFIHVIDEVTGNNLSNAHVKIYVDPNLTLSPDNFGYTDDKGDYWFWAIPHVNYKGCAYSNDGTNRFVYFDIPWNATSVNVTIPA